MANPLDTPDVLRLIAYKLRARDIIALCISSRKLSQDLCKNEYFLKQVYLKYLSRHLDNFKATDVLRQLNQYDELISTDPTYRGLLHFATKNGYDRILQALIFAKSAKGETLELLPIYFIQALDSKMNEDDLIDLFSKSNISNKIYLANIKKIYNETLKLKYFNLQDKIIQRWPGLI